MTDLVRTIEKADIPELREVLKLVFNDEEWCEISRLGGMTNHSYRILRKDGQELLVRIPGEGTEEMINREDEKKSTVLACQLGIDSELLYFDDRGRKVMRYIHAPQPMSEGVMKKPENLKQAAEIFYKLHNCGVDTGVRFEIFEMADLYEKIIQRSGHGFYDDYDDVKDVVMNVKADIDCKGVAKKVPCHNDSLLGNWVLEGSGKLYLVDWEYSGMNEPMWDLSCLSIEAGYSPENDADLLRGYFGREITTEEMKRFLASKLYVDYLWTLWGLTRVPFDGQFMRDYAKARYLRLKENISAYGKI